MKIVIDDKIPFIRDVFEPYAEVVYCKGSSINSEIVADADALVVRTRTKCNKNLLEGSKVKIVASATIGYDHIDTKWCESNGIKWTNAPGCNSGSVKQYITAALFLLASKHNLNLRSMTIGVIGVGNVGSKVVASAKAIGMNVLQNDPPRSRKEGDANFVSLDKIFADADIITVHVPYTREGTDKTHHLINGENLRAMKKDCYLFNSSRGEVVDNPALLTALESGHIAGTVLDVWEGEPDADRRLIARADISTPHIAGYSVDGKANGTIKAVREVSLTLGLPLQGWEPASLPQPQNPLIDLTDMPESLSPLEMAGTAVLATYPILKDNNDFKNHPENFESLRDNYWKRREFSSFTVITDNKECSAIVTLLGFNVKL
jgi:erythronate-4-phosphate dehydrogenase